MIPICLGAYIGFPDYGFFGFLTVVMFYLFRGFPLAWVAQLLGMVAINIVFFEGQVIPLELFGNYFEIPIQAFAVFALIPIWLYRGRRGSSSKTLQYGFYAFYPCHMIVLYLIKYFA